MSHEFALLTVSQCKFIFIYNLELKLQNVSEHTFNTDWKSVVFHKILYENIEHLAICFMCMCTILYQQKGH